MFELERCDECWCAGDCSEQDKKRAFFPICDSSAAVNLQKFSKFIEETVTRNTYPEFIDWKEVARDILQALSKRLI